MSKRLICCLILILILTSCKDAVSPIIVKEAQVPDKYLDFAIDDDKVYIEDIDAKNTFETIFQVKNINDSICYLVDNTLNVYVYCNDNVNYDDVKNIKLYFTNILVLKQYGTYPVPYGDLYNKRIKYDSCILRIFVNDKLLTYDKYDFNTNKFEYYENMSINISARNYSDNYSIDIIEKISKEVDKDIVVVTSKPFKGYSIMFKIITNEKLVSEDIELIKNIVEANITDRTDINSYVGIIVELSTNSEKYEEYTYINGTNKGWTDEKWETIDFTKEAVNLKK